VENTINNLKAFGHKTFKLADRVTGGILGILFDAIAGFSKSRGAEGAASITYFALFSIFPLLLSVVAIGSFFLEDGQIRLQVVRIIMAVVPVEPELIVDNIQEVLESRGAFGTIGVIGLVWSASAAFTILFRNINRAWVRAAPLNALLTRLVGVLVIFAIVLLLVLVRFASAAVNLLPALGINLGDDFYETYLWLAISSLIPPGLDILFIPGVVPVGAEHKGALAGSVLGCLVGGCGLGAQHEYIYVVFKCRYIRVPGRVWIAGYDDRPIVLVLH
jgi:membrane protein